MSTMFSRALHDKDGRTQITQSIMRSLISDSYVISESDWVLALVRKKGTEHAFLLVEGQRRDERKIFRSDLFLDASVRPRVVDALGSIDPSGVMEKLWSYAASTGHGTAFIRIAELSSSEYDALMDTDRCEYQSWNIDVKEATLLLQHLIKEADKKCIPYHIAGDHPSWMSSASTSYYHNCVTWCQEVIRTVFQGRLQIGTRWENLIKRPSEVILQAQSSMTVLPAAATTQAADADSSGGQRCTIC